MSQLLNLADNNIGDDGMRSLADAFAKGALKNVLSVDLARNQIGDAGCTALAEACASGALENCQSLLLGGNKIGDEGVHSLADALVKGAMANTEVSPSPFIQSQALRLTARTSLTLFFRTRWHRSSTSGSTTSAMTGCAPWRTLFPRAH